MIKIVQKDENEVLRKKAENVKPEQIAGAEIKAMIAKMKQAIIENEEAVAIAAPQIGYSLRVFVISEYVFSPSNGEKKKSEYGFMVFINPQITKKSREQKKLAEGCLSVINVYGTTKRSEKIKIEAYNESGEKFIKSGSGLFAQAIQHETDHLDGILFTDKATGLSKITKS